jgi:PKD repeat protein
MLRNLLLLLVFLLQSVFLLAQECGVIYVSPTGAGSGAAGTKANPASLDYGLTLVSPANKKIRMAEGDYPITQPLQMLSDLTIEGGFDETTWIKSNRNITRILRDNSNIQAVPPALIGINCVNISNFRLMELRLEVEDATGNGVSVYGIYISGCSEYTISRCYVTVGDASDGLPGDAGTTGLDGTNGTGGETGEDVGNCCRAGGIGASGSFPGSNAGGDGGEGAEWGGFEVEEQCILGFCQWIVSPGSEYTNNGLDGENGEGYAPGQGGNGGIGMCELTYQNTNCLAQTINHGVRGTDGADGIEGFNGLQGEATFAGGWYVPGIGEQGDAGQTNGAGGGGGGGGGAKGCEPAALDPYIPTPNPIPYPGDTAYHNAGSGGGGGGGGEGGQAGGGGLGGSGGGGSFCVFVYGNGINGIVQDCYLTPGDGGQGGPGGAGGQGGQGGLGGEGGVLGDFGPDHSCNNGEGGDGGNGGQGGQGGSGGKGSDGMSAAFYEFDGTAQVLRPYNYNRFEPEIRVEYYGCTNSDVVIETDTTGIINWIFGYGATPAGSEENTDSVQYSGPLGFRNISLIVDGVPFFYANFVDITTDFTPPEVVASKTTFCAGQSTDLSSSGSAQTYEWTIPGGSITSSTDQSPGTVTFDTPGDYIVELITTSCCGTSKAVDTIHVLDAVVIDLGPDTAICYLQDMPFLNAGGNAGAVYSWTLDGSPISDDTQIVQAVGPGDYSVTVDYGSGCSGTDNINLDVFIVLPVDLGADDAVCVNANFPVLDAGIPNATTYAWNFNGNPIGENSQFLQTILPGDYSITITSAEGCMGGDTMNLFVSDPSVNIGFDEVMCTNEAYPLLNAGNPGATYVWKWNGIQLSGETSQTYQTLQAGTYQVIMTDPYGCVATDDMTVTVLPTINAQFSSPNTAQINTPVSFTDLTAPAPSTWNWNFGDGSPNVFIQNPVYTYTEVGTHPVFLIAANATCSDTAIHIIDVQWNCTNLGLVADFTMNTDTVILSGLGTVTVTNTSVNAEQWFWDFGDGSFVETSENPVHAYTEPGIYTITQTAINYNCTTSVSHTIIVVEFGVGVSELTVDNGQLTIYPNPNSGVFTITFETEKPVTLELELTNAIGQRVYFYQAGTTKYFSEKLNLEGFSKGLYLFKVRAGDEVVVKKVVVE